MSSIHLFLNKLGPLPQTEVSTRVLVMWVILSLIRPETSDQSLKVPSDYDFKTECSHKTWRVIYRLCYVIKEILLGLILYVSFNRLVYLTLLDSLSSSHQSYRPPLYFSQNSYRLSGDTLRHLNLFELDQNSTVSSTSGRSLRYTGLVPISKTQDEHSDGYHKEHERIKKHTEMLLKGKWLHYTWTGTRNVRSFQVVFTQLINLYTPREPVSSQ